MNYFYHFSICLFVLAFAAFNIFICKWYLLLLDYRNQITFSTNRFHNSKWKWTEDEKINENNNKKTHTPHRKLRIIVRKNESNRLQQDTTMITGRPNLYEGKKANNSILLLFIPLITEKEIGLRVFYQLCASFCQICARCAALYLCILVCWIICLARKANNSNEIGLE